MHVGCCSLEKLSAHLEDVNPDVACIVSVVVLVCVLCYPSGCVCLLLIWVRVYEYINGWELVAVMWSGVWAQHASYLLLVFLGQK